MKRFVLATYTIFLPWQLKFPTVPLVSMVNVYLLLLFVTLVVSEKKGLNMKTRPAYHFPIALFWMIATFSLINGIIQVTQFVGLPVMELVTEFKRIVTLVLGYYVFTYCVTTKEDLRFFTHAFVLSIVLVGVQTMRTGVLGGANFGDHKRAYGPFGVDYNASDIAGGFIATFTPFVFSYFLFEKNKLFKMAAAVGLGICVMGLFATYARGALLAFVFGCAVMFALALPELMKRSKLYGVFTVFALIVLMATWQVWVPESIIKRTSETVVVSEEESQPSILEVESMYEHVGSLDTAGLPAGFDKLDLSSQMRILRWRNMMNLIQENFMFGIGFRQTLYLYDVDAHNSFLQIGAEMSIFGLLVFLWMLFCVFREGFKLMKTEYAILGAGAVGAIASFCAVNNFYSNFFRNTVVGTFWIALGLLAAAKRLYLDNQVKVVEVKPKTPQRKKVRKDKYYAWVVIFLLPAQTAWGSIEADRWYDLKQTPTLNVYDDLSRPNGKIWYVDGTNGNDKNAGTSWKTPFKTIKRAVNSHGPVRAGDTVLIKAGRYTESLFIRAQGEDHNRVLIGPAGDGEVVIDASMQLGPWTQFFEGIYKTACPTKPTAVVAQDIPLYPEVTLDALKPSRWFYDEKQRQLYVHTPDGTSPADQEFGVVRDDKFANAINFHGATNVTLYGLTIKYAGGKGIEIQGRNNRIEKCKIMFNGNSGIVAWVYKDGNTDNAQFIKNYVAHNFIRNWPRGRYKTGFWGSGISGGNSNNSLIQGNIIHDNGGEGINAIGTNVLIQDNLVYNNWSVNLYASDRTNVTFDRNLVYCEDPDRQHLYNNGDPSPKDGKNFRRLRAEGIMTADEGEVGTTHSINITNNIIIGCRRGITHYGKGKGSGLKNVKVAHNTIILPNSKGLDESFVGIMIPYNDGSNAGTSYTNNIVYGTHADNILLSVQNSLVGTGDPTTGIMLNSNIFYNAANPKTFHMGPRWSTFMRTTFDKIASKHRRKAWFNNNKFVDPQLSRPLQYASSAARLEADSPAYQAGLNTHRIVTDYFAAPRSSDKPTIGAIERNPEVTEESIP